MLPFTHENLHHLFSTPQHSPKYTQNPPPCTTFNTLLHGPPYSQHKTACTQLNLADYTMHPSALSTLKIASQYTQHTEKCTLYTLHSMLYSVYCSLYSKDTQPLPLCPPVTLRIVSKEDFFVQMCISFIEPSGYNSII